MDFSERLDALQQRVAAAKAAAKTAATESREQIGKRIDQTQLGIAKAVQNAQKQTERAASEPAGWSVDLLRRFSIKLRRPRIAPPSPL